MLNIKLNFNFKKNQKLKSIKTDPVKSSRQEMFEDQYYKDIHEIMDLYPMQIEYRIFKKVEQYMIFSSKFILNDGPNKGLKVLNGSFYAVSPNDILFKGRSVREDVSSEFISKVYQELISHYKTKFQPQISR